MPGDLPQAPVASRIEEHLANFVPRPRPANKDENAALRYLSPEGRTKQLRGSEEWVQQLLRSTEEHQVAAPPWCLASPPHQSREEADFAETEEIAFNKKSVTDTPHRSEALLAGRSSLRQDKMPATAGHSAEESSAVKDAKDEGVFKQYDDGDGVLSRDELKRMQEETSKLAKAVSSVWSDSKRALGDSPCRMQFDFDKLDTDGDGVVSKDELAAALVRTSLIGRAPQHLLARPVFLLPHSPFATYSVNMASPGAFDETVAEFAAIAGLDLVAPAASTSAPTASTLEATPVVARWERMLPPRASRPESPSGRDCWGRREDPAVQTEGRCLIQTVIAGVILELSPEDRARLG
ncbi:hypothetical protein AK812_SmicGene33254 [Symbiodinium microadriaticum]|uniref:EF-hand domain-containing protein n=1 Tax=Symbiodinium microadriaticum TaxID=2951 RepID=A0A1Q9CS24_SYMMI|nr:hypothetical protein AK812_SmicGene33254 [Symbiodinium microadriaticum]